MASMADIRCRFNDIAWTRRENEQSRGIIAGALENGSLDLWDAGKLLNMNRLGLSVKILM